MVTDSIIYIPADQFSAETSCITSPFILKAQMLNNLLIVFIAGRHLGFLEPHMRISRVPVGQNALQYIPSMCGDIGNQDGGRL
jgi:hypothetical protein